MLLILDALLLHLSLMLALHSGHVVGSLLFQGIHLIDVFALLCRHLVSVCIILAFHLLDMLLLLV